MGITALRRTLVAALAVLAVLSAASAGAALAQGAGAEAGFAGRIDHERGAHGLAPLAQAGDLTEVARRHAQRMAARGEPYHNPSLGSEVQGWEVVGENVGVGYEVDSLHRAFMDSASHRANILHRDLTELGVGVVSSPDGRIWVVQVFRRPSGAVSSSAPPPPEPAAPAPAPAPAAAPAPEPTSSAPAPEPEAAAPAAPAPATGPGDGDQRSAAASVATPAEIEVQGVSFRPAQAQAAPPVSAVLADDLARAATEIPPQAWVAALALVAAVAVQGTALCRLGLVAGPAVPVAVRGRRAARR